MDPINMLLKIQQQRAHLKVSYNHWLKVALEEGYTTSDIARKLHVTEAAIRMYRKRNNL